MMTWQESLELMVGRTGHLRYRELCDESHPDHEQWRALMIEQASGPPPGPSQLIPTGLPLAGDIVEMATKRLGIARLTKYISDQLGADCGCSVRQRKLNELDLKLRKWLRS